MLVKVSGISPAAGHEVTTTLRANTHLAFAFHKGAAKPLPTLYSSVTPKTVGLFHGLYLWVVAVVPYLHQQRSLRNRLGDLNIPRKGRTQSAALSSRPEPHAQKVSPVRSIWSFCVEINVDRGTESEYMRPTLLYPGP